MQAGDDKPIKWDFDQAISLLRNGVSPECAGDDGTAQENPPIPAQVPHLLLSQPESEDLSLGNFNSIWDFLSGKSKNDTTLGQANGTTEKSASKEVRWRDEVSGGDLEDNAEDQTTPTDASVRTQKRAARRARAVERRQQEIVQKGGAGAVYDSVEENDSGPDTSTPRRKVDRRAVIQEMLFGPGKIVTTGQGPASAPSGKHVRVLKQESPTSGASALPPALRKSSHKRDIVPLEGLSPIQRRQKLLARLAGNFAPERKRLKNEALVHREFIPLNTSPHGIHVFVDISNIMIGFHDRLKEARNIPSATRIRRVPMSFHHLSLILERGRPAAKRVLVGSDRLSTIDQARAIGYETNILERVHKIKDLTPRQKKFRASNESGTSGISSGNESETMRGPREKWVEQAVDEILHLKILESLLDTETPAVVCVASGDAAEAEYSGGFLRMVERALHKGWRVEVVSFAKNTGRAYRGREFLARWGDMFRWIGLDEFVEDLVDDVPE